FGHLTIVGSTQGPRHRLREVLELHARAGARTIVEPYPLSQALDAYERVETGQARFRAVIVPETPYPSGCLPSSTLVSNGRATRQTRPAVRCGSASATNSPR